MTVSTTGRFGFKTYGAGTDPHPTRVEFNAQQELLDANASMFAQGTTAARPAAGKAGRFYWDSTVSRLYYDDGSAWSEVSVNGGGGAGKPIVPNTAGVEGTSSRSARADHTHNLPLATASADGAMSAADKALLNGASATPTVNTLVKLDSFGRAQVATPSAAGEIANKGYVDTQRDTRAPSDHNHDASDVTSGTFAVARLPLVTVAVAGAMLAADKVKLDNAVSAATAARLVMRDAAGRAQFADPAVAADAATKGYVDGQVGTRAPSAHTHSYSSLSGIPSTFASDWGTLSGKPLIFPSDWANVADKPTVFASDWASVSGKPTTFASTWASVSGKPTTFAPSAHDHPWGDLTGVPATFTPSAHNHSASEITSGTFAAARLPLATASAAGALSAPDKALLDGRKTSGWANSLVVRDDGGRFGAQSPVLDDDVATKGYVDGGLNGRLTKSEAVGRITFGSNYTHFKSPDGGTLIACNDSGTVASAAIFNSNAASGSSYRAVWVNSSGVIGYNLSARKYKTDERDYVVPLSVLDEITPKRYKLKSDIEELGDAAPDRVNFIADDLHAAGLTEYVSYNGEGTDVEHVETINEQLMVNALWSFAKQMKERLDKAGL